MDDDDPCMWTFARNVALAGFDGWLGLREVMISKPRTSLKYEGTRLIGDQDD
jgi:hypothetical protein